jgi:hypothetical protein
MGLDAKTYWLTDRQSHCDFDFDFDFGSRVEFIRKWFFACYSSQWKRRRSWSSEEWSEPQAAIYCELF